MPWAWILRIEDSSRQGWPSIDGGFHGKAVIATPLRRLSAWSCKLLVSGTGRYDAALHRNTSSTEIEVRRNLETMQCSEMLHGQYAADSWNMPTHN
jgi:hypothetical protein